MVCRSTASSVTIRVPSEEGYQIIAVEDSLGEELVLTVPLSLNGKTTSEWLEALERAIKYSLACRITYCSATLPEMLTGADTTDTCVEGQGMYPLVQLSFHLCVYLYCVEGYVMNWLGESVSQAVLLALELYWSRLLESVCDGEYCNPDYLTLAK